jgi:hypothetical protein
MASVTATTGRQLQHHRAPPPLVTTASAAATNGGRRCYQWPPQLLGTVAAGGATHVGSPCALGSGQGIRAAVGEATSTSRPPKYESQKLDRRSSAWAHTRAHQLEGRRRPREVGEERRRRVIRRRETATLELRGEKWRANGWCYGGAWLGRRVRRLRRYQQLLREQKRRQAPPARLPAAAARGNRHGEPRIVEESELETKIFSSGRKSWVEITWALQRHASRAVSGGTKT